MDCANFVQQGKKCIKTDNLAIHTRKQTDDRQTDAQKEIEELLLNNMG